MWGGNSDRGATDVLVVEGRMDARFYVYTDTIYLQTASPHSFGECTQVSIDLCRTTTQNILRVLPNNTWLTTISTGGAHHRRAVI